MDGVETYWIWLIVGLTLAMLEMVVPGVYLIWLAMAALGILPASTARKRSRSFRPGSLLVARLPQRSSTDD